METNQSLAPLVALLLLRKLEDAGYLCHTTSFEGRIPRTAYHLTAAGRRALDRYVDHMGALLHASGS